MTKKKLLKPAQPELDRQLREFEAALHWMTGRWYSPAEQVVIAQNSPSSGPVRRNAQSLLLTG